MPIPLTAARPVEKSSIPGTGLAFVIGFYLSFRLIFTVSLVRVVGANPQSGSIVRIASGFLLVAAAWLWLLGSSQRSLTHLARLPTLRWVCIYLALSLCSLLWGEASSPAASLAYWCGTASDVILIALLIRSNHAPAYAASLMRGFICSTCVIAIIAWLMPAQYDLRLGDEAYFNSNSIANLAVTAILFAQYLTKRSTRSNWSIPISFLAITVLRTLSKTTIVAFAVAESYLILRDRSMSRRKKLLIILSAVGVLLLFWGLLAAYFDFYTSYGNESVTLTGRTAIWAYLAEHSLERPWFGHGFDSMWNVVPVFGTFEARHAENELLEQFYSYGVAGIIVVIGLYADFYRTVRRHCPSPERAICIAMLLYVVIRGTAEAEPFDLLMPLWVLTLLGFLAVQSWPAAEAPAVLENVPATAV